MPITETILNQMRSLVWFRGNDLRLRDQLPLATALRQGEVLLVYVLEPEFEAKRVGNGSVHRLRFLRQILECLQADIEERGSRLLLFSGDPTIVLPWLVETCHVDQIVAERATDPDARGIVSRLESKLRVPLRLFDGETLFVPGSMRTTAGEPYSVFTAFARSAGKNLEIARPLPLPARLPPVPKDVILRLSTATQPAKANELRLRELPEIFAGDLHEGLIRGGEREALQRLKVFVTKTAETYETTRDRLALHGTSRLSADLRFGSISPRQVWTAASKSISNDVSRKRFLSQLLWREFAYSTLWDRPELLQKPFQARFAQFPWRRDETAYRAWVEGRTGYPIVDAAARQLLREGFVHNRARMIAASFLAKDLLVDFRLGEGHYLEWLIDGDRAQNDLGWQWSSGSGCDAQPYFRIFNPVTQGEKFDADGDYVRRYVPELARLPNRFIHKPWSMPSLELSALAVRIGRDYPAPIVDHAGARNRFLAIAAEHFQSLEAMPQR